jgi:hypothetical protein
MLIATDCLRHQGSLSRRARCTGAILASSRMHALTTAPSSPQVHWRRCRNARLRQRRIGHEQERRLGHEKERRIVAPPKQPAASLHAPAAPAAPERLGRRNFEHVDEPPTNRRNFEAVGRNAEALGRNAEAVDAPKPIWQRSQSGAILAANAPSAEAEAPLPSLSRAAARRVGRHVIEAEAPEPNVWSLSVRAQDGARLARSPSSPSPCMHALTTAPPLFPTGAPGAPSRPSVAAQLAPLGPHLPLLLPLRRRCRRDAGPRRDAGRMPRRRRQ